MEAIKSIFCCCFKKKKESKEKGSVYLEEYKTQNDYLIQGIVSG